MSGVQKPADIPIEPIERDSLPWMEFFRRLIARKPQLEEVHLVDAGIVYLGDESTNNSWRMVRSGDNLVFQRLESGTWTTKDTITP